MERTTGSRDEMEHQKGMSNTDGVNVVSIVANECLAPGI
jgi:hypothetical protein